MVEKISVRNKPKEFIDWLERLKLAGFSYELIIEYYYIERVYVKESDDGNWKNISHGRVIGSSGMGYKQTTYMPRMVDGKFIYNYNGN